MGIIYKVNKTGSLAFGIPKAMKEDGFVQGVHPILAKISPGCWGLSIPPKSASVPVLDAKPAPVQETP